MSRHSRVWTIGVALVIGACGARSGLQSADGPGRAPTICTPISPTTIYVETATNPFNGNAAMAMDKEGVVHFAFGTWQGLSHAVNSSAGWQTTVVDPNSFGYGVAIAIDAQQKPHLGWHATTSVHYATGTAGAWSAKVVIKPKKVKHTVGLAVSDQGHGHITFVDAETQEFWHISNQYGSWDKAVTLGPVSGRTAIAAGRTMIHTAFIRDGLEHAREYHGWESFTIDETVRSTSIALAMDNKDDVHVAYGIYPHGPQRFASFDKGIWRVETVDPRGGGHSSLVLKGAKVYLGYVLGNALKLAIRVGETWTIRDVDPTREVQWSSCSVQVGDAGDVHLGYRDANSGDVLYTVLCP